MKQTCISIQKQAFILETGMHVHFISLMPAHAQPGPVSVQPQVFAEVASFILLLLRERLKEYSSRQSPWLGSRVEDNKCAYCQSVYAPVSGCGRAARNVGTREHVATAPICQSLCKLPLEGPKRWRCLYVLVHSSCYNKTPQSGVKKKNKDLIGFLK